MLEATSFSGGRCVSDVKNRCSLKKEEKKNQRAGNDTILVFCKREGVGLPLAGKHRAQQTDGSKDGRRRWLRGDRAWLLHPDVLGSDPGFATVQLGILSRVILFELHFPLLQNVQIMVSTTQE